MVSVFPLYTSTRYPMDEKTKNESPNCITSLKVNGNAAIKKLKYLKIQRTAMSNTIPTLINFTFFAAQHVANAMAKRIITI